VTVAKQKCEGSHRETPFKKFKNVVSQKNC
jgi:hypothetical protein